MKWAATLEESSPAGAAQRGPEPASIWVDSPLDLDAERKGLSLSPIALCGPCPVRLAVADSLREWTVTASVKDTLAPEGASAMRFRGSDVEGNRRGPA